MVEIIFWIEVIDAFGEVAVAGKAVKFGKLEKDMLSTCSLIAEADILDEKFHITAKKFSADFDGDS